VSSEVFSGDDVDLRVSRRLGTAPSGRASCSSSGNCPDVFELSTGDFAIVGEDVSTSLELPADAGRSDTERIVRVPRDVLFAAARNLLDSV
jgi:hypothetical protein